MKKFYHGAKKRGPYFEGWYLKHQTEHGDALALIPSLHIDAAGRRSASLQVLADHQSWWLEYPDMAFRASQASFQIQLEQNRFTCQGVQLNIQRTGLSLHGTLRFGAFTPLASDIMGPFRFCPEMECSHGMKS